MKNSRWFDEVAEGWEVLRLKRAVILSKARTDERHNDLRYIGLENIESRTGRLLGSVDKAIGEEDVVESSSIVNYFEPGDVLFGKLRPYLAKAHLVTEHSVGTTEFLALKPKQNLHGRFLLYVLLSPGFIGLVNSSTFGSKMPRADWEFIGNVFIPRPPLAEQQAIADLLDRETAQLDNLIAEKERLLKLLAEKRRTLITRAVTQGVNTKALLHDSDFPWIGQISASWQIIRLKFVVDKIGSGKTPSGGADAYVPSGIPLIRSQNVRFEGLSLDDVVFIDEQTDEQMSNSRVMSGDVLLNITGASIGRCCLVPTSIARANVNQHVCILRPVQEIIDGRYLSRVLESAVGQFQVFLGEEGVSREGLNFEDLGNFVIVLPDLNEQHDIAEYIETETKKLDDLQAETERTINLLKERRAALITAAITGHIAVEVQT